MENDPSAAARALVRSRKRAPGECIRCGTEFPPSYTNGKGARLYCSQTCRQLAYVERHPRVREKANEKARERYQRRRQAAQPDAPQTP
jgi:hypothetical protein